MAEKEKQEIIRCLISIERIFYPRGEINAGDWSSFVALVEDEYMGNVLLSNSGTIRVNGIVPELNYIDKYVLLAKYVYHETYGDQYEILHMNKLVNLQNPIEQRQFLEYVLTDNQINTLYEQLDNPFEAIKAEDYDTLTSVKGIGLSTAQSIVAKYKDNVDNGMAYVELDSFGLTKYMIDKLIDVYKSADILVSKIKENPYILIEEVDGIGWKRADEMALNSGIEPNSSFRISAYITYYLKQKADDGDTWVTPQELVEETLGALNIEEVDRFREVLYELNEKGTLQWNEDKTQIALTQYYDLENNIAEELKRLVEAPVDTKALGYDLEIKRIEGRQEFDFTEEQLDAMKLALNNAVCIITGGGGVGKSTAVSGVLKILGTEFFAQTALSGRAAARLSEITNEEGFTIHRLLGYNPVKGFAYNKHNQLQQEVIILDEVSMVGADLFYRLIQSIPTGSRLIMIGDDGQLESIGLCNIFKDMLNSGVIPVARLTKIHRQAAKSAIITESIKVRNHEQLVPHEWVGEEVRGELHDLELSIYGDKILSQKRIIEKYNHIYLQCRDASKIQIVVPQKYKGEICTYNLNSIIQEIVNPNGKKPIEISYKVKSTEVQYTLKEGDKVIVNKNNYKTETPDGDDCPIFNGNKGTIKHISFKPNRMIVDFEQWGEVVIPKDKWNTIELAYALSCHKLQGSEADYVIIGLDFTARTLLTKEWLYTAITRAKKYCVLCAETKALEYCITNSNVPYKRTFLKTMLMNQFAKQIA